MKQDDAIMFIARVLLAQLFLVSGIGKVEAYAATQGYMASMGVPGSALPLVIVLELGGAAALLVGLLTRWVALGLAGFCVGSALLFHLNFADPAQAINFMKNISIAGGMLVLYVHGAGEFSVDAVRAGREIRKSRHA